jgi:intracellular sulfur oxidation DsrE/DsrF family protein
LFGAGAAHAQTNSPWGSAQHRPGTYAPQKVVYDVAVRTPAELDRVLDRISGLQNVYHADPMNASIVVVLHGDEMDYFDARQFTHYETLMRRAQSLTVSGVIEFRMCSLAAASRGLKAENVHGFVQMIPMGDAEIVRLQQEESYAYMH